MKIISGQTPEVHRTHETSDWLVVVCRITITSKSPIPIQKFHARIFVLEPESRDAEIDFFKAKNQIPDDAVQVSRSGIDSWEGLEEVAWTWYVMTVEE